MLLPNPLTQSGVIAGLIFHGAQGFMQQGQWSGLATGLVEGFLGAVLGIWLFDLLRIGGTLALGQEAMGGGDAKLAAMIGGLARLALNASEFPAGLLCGSCDWGRGDSFGINWPTTTHSLWSLSGVGGWLGHLYRRSPDLDLSPLDGTIIYIPIPDKIGTL